VNRTRRQEVEVSETKFTPGPWQIVEHQVPNVVGPNGELVGGSNPYGCVETSEANARLIASAPELYEALETVRPLLMDFSTLYSFNAEVDDSLSQEEVAELRLVKDTKAAFSVIDAALAKARGE
jgi:hypothetical protein